MAQRKNWSREELILAFNLYCKTPFGRMHGQNPDVIALASLLGRTPAAVAWKLANFASLDESLEQKGAAHSSKKDAEIFEEFSNNWELLSLESEKMLSQLEGKDIEDVVKEEKEVLPQEGKEREAAVKIRINQHFFRRTILAAYDNKCCITGLAIPDLLIASHIVPWSIDKHNRVNPKNGLCLNSLHDRAFDRGLLTVTPDFKVKLSPIISTFMQDEIARNFLLKYENAEIHLPSRFKPDLLFLEWHNREVFQN